MKNIKYLLISICIFICSSSCLAEIYKFNQFLKVSEDFKSTFIWKDESENISLNTLGLLNGIIKLPMETGEFIEKVLGRKYKSNFILAYEKTDGETSYGNICSINLKNNKRNWCQQISGFNINVSEGIDGIYVGAIGFMGRVDPKNGQYVWRLENLYQNDSTMNMISLVSETELNVIFSATSGIDGSVIKEITIKKDTGKIISSIVIDKNM